MRIHIYLYVMKTNECTYTQNIMKIRGYVIIWKDENMYKSATKIQDYMYITIVLGYEKMEYRYNQKKYM